MQSETLQLAINKAQNLPEAAQEELGRDVLLRIKEIEELRAKIRVGVTELDAGKSGPLDLRKIKAEARRQYAARPQRGDLVAHRPAGPYRILGIPRPRGLADDSRPSDRSGSDIRESRLPHLQESNLLHRQKKSVYCKLHKYIIRMNRVNVQQ